MGVHVLTDLPRRIHRAVRPTTARSQEQGGKRNRWLAARYYALWQARLWTQNEGKFPDTQRALDRALLADAPLEPGQTYEVPRVRAAFADFLRIASTSTHPIILDAAQPGSWKPPAWTLDDLALRYGDTQLKFVERDDAGSLSSATMDLPSYVRAIRGGQNRYIAASAKLFADNAELLDQFPLEEIQQLTGRRVVRIEAFIGGADMGSSFHCAGIGNLFCQVHGKKRWTMVSPAYTQYMYPMIGELPYTIYVNSPIRSRSYEAQRERYPLYDFAPKYVATLSPGDILFNPSWWWHEVRNLEETIGVPIRLMPSWRLNMPFSMLTLSSLPLNMGVLADVGRNLGKGMDLADSGKLHDAGAKSINLD